MWTGAISFGMVTIPVKLHTATESHNIAFHQLHDTCNTRIKELRWCPHCQRKVEWEEIVKGYEQAKNEYVELTDEDFDKLPLPSKQTIDLSSFVDAAEISPLYCDSFYYIEVDEKGGQKPYKLLLQVMESQDVVGIGKVTFRNKERLCALRPINGTLGLQTLLYDDEIKPNESSKPASVSVSPQEKKMAESLVGTLKGHFEPEKFKDHYQIALKQLIQSKIKGVGLKQPKLSEPSGALDLMEALRASVDRAKGQKGSSTKVSSTPNKEAKGKAKKRAVRSSSVKHPVEQSRVKIKAQKRAKGAA
jgi:DNA end-binding protein Ku